jgi:hypothetical protein
MTTTILPDLGGRSENYCFRAGPVLDPPHITDTAPDTYSLDVVRYHENADGSLRFEHLELMRMQGEDGHVYMEDATEKFNRMLAEVGPEPTERAAKTWGRLHGAHIQDWREISEDDLLQERTPAAPGRQIEIE